MMRDSERKVGEITATISAALDLGLRANCPVLSGNMFSHIVSERYGQKGRKIIISAPYYDLSKFKKSMRKSKSARKWTKANAFRATKKGNIVVKPKTRLAKAEKRFASGDRVKDFDYAWNVEAQGAFGGHSRKSKDWIENTIRKVLSSLPQSDVEVIIEL